MNRTSKVPWETHVLFIWWPGTRKLKPCLFFLTRPLNHFFNNFFYIKIWDKEMSSSSVANISICLKEIHLHHNLPNTNNCTKKVEDKEERCGLRSSRRSRCWLLGPEEPSPSTSPGKNNQLNPFFVLQWIGFYPFFLEGEGGWWCRTRPRRWLLM